MNRDHSGGWRQVAGCLLCWALMWPMAAWGQARVLDRAWFLDATGEMTLPAVQAQRWQPAPELLSLGYSPQVLWVRLRVQVPLQDGPWVLRMRPSYLDDVRLYEPDRHQPGSWRVHQTGDTQSFDQRDRASSALGFVWHPTESGVHTLYLRVATTSSLMFNVEVLDEREAQFRDAQLDGFMLFYLSIMLCMVLWGVFDYVVHRGRVNLWFVAAQLNSVVVALSVLGYLPRVLPMDWATVDHGVTGVSVCLSTMLYIGFYRSMLADNVPSMASRRAAGLAMWVFLAQMVAMVWGHHQWAVMTNALMAVFVAVPVFLWMVFTTQHDGLLKRRAWYLVGIFQALLSSTVMLPLLGFTSLSLFKMHSTLFVSMSSALLMLAVLMLRSVRTMQAAHEDRLRLDLMAQRLELEQQQRQEQRQLLDMLGHELKTPLMTIRLASHALLNATPSDDAGGYRRLQRIDASAQAMSQVLERVVEANRVDAANLPLELGAVSLGALLSQLKATLSEPERLHVSGHLALALWTDPDQVRVVLTNLLDNACKYSPPGSLIGLDVGVKGDVCVLTVRNELGSLVAPDPVKVFQKYHRAEEVKSLPGAGVGLWLSHHLAHRLGGSLSVKTFDQCVEFCFCLPLSNKL